MRLHALAVLLVIPVSGCTGIDGGAATTVPAAPHTTQQATTTPTIAAEPTTTSTAPPATTTTVDPHAPPDWLGTRLLPLRPDGFGEVLPTPDELVVRAFRTHDLLPPPVGDSFTATVTSVPDDVLARSTWTPECPVTLEELAYVTVAHRGFDGLPHTGELIVNAEYADAIVGVFSQLWDANFPIEQMRVIRKDELDAPPTGDGNVTTAFVCRPAVGSGSWSMHAYGLAIDINPFHNPYLKADLVLPELASFYVDRDLGLPGMIGEGDRVVEAFESIGWFWGGRWSTLDDWMHFSVNNR
jgi:hypothetical protein